MDNGDRKKIFFILIILFLLFNLAAVNGIIIHHQFSNSFTVFPGENYIINIPFKAHETSICGNAVLLNDSEIIENIQGINISVSGERNYSTRTDENGEYCIDLVGVYKPKEYNAYVEYDNESLVVLSKKYHLTQFNTSKNSYSRGESAILKGVIGNEDAEIKNGRIIQKIKCKELIGEEECNREFVSSKTYYVNISPKEDYEVPNNNLNLTWQIPENMELGKYEFYTRVSFNGNGRKIPRSGSKLDFNITS